MKRFIEGENRFQCTLFPESLEDYIAADNPVRAIDAFVDGLDLKRFDGEIAVTAQKLPDYDLLFRPLPGAAKVLAPRLLAAFGEDRQRYPQADALQKYSGIAPVTKHSGQSTWVHWRWQCPTFVRQTFVDWAAQTINKSAWAGACYRQQGAKGCSYQVAVRALAFKWIRILHRCWQNRTPYDESKYLEALRRKGSPLLKYLAHSA